MRAALLFRPNRHYRAAEFARGLARHGYAIEHSHQRSPRQADLLVIWNRTRAHEAAAALYERAGARVVVAENGYLDRIDGEKFYSLALGRHNGAGRWFVGDELRFQIEEEPWGSRGDAVVVLAQRGIGQPGVAMPPRWPAEVRERLSKITKRPIVVRRHPGLQSMARPLEADLNRAHCVVTWASGAAIKAVRAGIPCFHEMAGWIGDCASQRLADSVEQCDSLDRGPLWRRITWAQWTMREIECGEAFDRLLHAESDRLFCTREPSVVHDRPRHGGGNPPLRRRAAGQAVDDLQGCSDR